MKYNLVKILFSVFSLILQTGNLLGQSGLDSIHTFLATQYSMEELQRHLSWLADDAREGREAGQPGNDSAAAYIANHFQQIGLPPVKGNTDYSQTFEMVVHFWENITCQIGKRTFRHKWDFFAPSEENVGSLVGHFDEVVFAGYGMKNEEHNHYGQTDIRNRIVIFYGHDPADKIETSITKTDKKKILQEKIEKARIGGARFVFVIDPDYQEQITGSGRYAGPVMRLRPPTESGSEGAAFGYAEISPDMAKELLGLKLKKVIRHRKKLDKGKSKNALIIPTDLTVEFQKSMSVNRTSNVIGFLPGAEESQNDECIIVTAHYDHIGQRGDDVFNGADDNGSGTATLLELSRVFSLAQKNGIFANRPIAFMLVSAEEKGLLGSKFYTDHPLIPLENTMVNVNIDMIGRTDDKHDDPNYVYVIGADRLSTTLHEVNEEVNSKFEKLAFDYTYNAKDDPNRFYYRSDHYNFAKNNIPAVFFFSGTHEDYHRPGDDTEKIQFPKLTKIGRHLLHLIWELANREESVEVDVFSEEKLEKP